MDNTKQLKHLSLCTGYGGIDLGLSRALTNVVPVCYVEIKAFSCYNLVKKIEAGLMAPAPIWTDLKTFPWAEFRGRVDILSGGFPCQPFSTAGLKKGDEDPRHLWPYLVRGIKELDRPPLVFLENVMGLISSRLKGDEWADPASTPILLHVLRELERLGYQAEASIFSAAEVGAPHQRKRVFILACRSDLGESGRSVISTMLRDSGMFNAPSPAYPAPRGSEQYTWEPPRVTVAHARCRHKKSHELKSPLLREPRAEGETAKLEWSVRHGSQAEKSNTQPSMGGGSHGVAYRLDYAKLCESLDHRTDELRMLGNGVVPATAERAFRVLWRRLEDAHER